MQIILDHKIRIAIAELPNDILESIQEALTIPNMVRQKAMEQDLYGWREMPDFIELWDWDIDPITKTVDLIMPRGFLPNLIDGLTEMGILYELDDRRVRDDVDPMGNKISLLRWQEPAKVALLTNTDGIWKAPAGSGKTVGVLDTIRALAAPAIVLVNTKDVMYQWRDRAKQFLGEEFPVSLIGDKNFEISDYLTVATIQTINRRFDRLEENGFFEQFTFVCLDECHHATAETYNKIVNRFSARWRCGVSATPDKTGDFALATNVLGPIIHTTKREDVDSLTDPDIFKISTDFNFKYQGKIGRRSSNYPQLISTLIRDDDRNALITKAIMIEDGSHSLVISKRLEHLDEIANRLEKAGYQHIIMMLTGKETSEARAKVIEQAALGPCVVLSTLADEALDIPRLDRLFLVFPQRNAGLIQQQVGRVARACKGKADAKVFDFADVNVGPLEAQWRIRRINVYQQHGYNITPVSWTSIMEFDPDDEE